MSRFYLTACLILTFNWTFSQTDPFQIGEIVKIQSTALNEERIINVYLPPNYMANDTVKYPVLYVLDGSAHEDFLHIVGLVQFFQLQMGLVPTIVVGIANVDRRRDFTTEPKDSTLKINFPTSGGLTNFLNFIESELIPTVQKRYSVNSNSTIIGQSLGGLLAAEIIYKRPYLFSNYIVVSPSLWWDRRALLKTDPDFSKLSKPVNIIVSVGSEGFVMKAVARQFYRKLKPKSMIKRSFNLMRSENHATILHNAVYQSFLELAK